MNRELGWHDDDPDGPFRDCGRFPRCPKCKSDDTASEPGMCQLVCNDCSHTWVPMGVYPNVDPKLAGKALSRRRWRRRRAA